MTPLIETKESGDNYSAHAQLHSVAACGAAAGSFLPWEISDVF